MESIDEAVQAVERVKSLDRAEVRACFERRFSVDVMAQGYEAAYRTVLQAGAEEKAIQVPHSHASVSPSKVTTEVAIGKRAGRRLPGPLPGSNRSAWSKSSMGGETANRVELMEPPLAPRERLHVLKHDDLFQYSTHRAISTAACTRLGRVSAPTGCSRTILASYPDLPLEFPAPSRNY